METFGQMIRTARKSRNWTQQRLGDELDLAPVYISHIEIGRARPSFLVADKLCEILSLERSSAFLACFLASGEIVVPLAYLECDLVELCDLMFKRS